MAAEYLQFEFLDALFDLDRVFCLSDWSFPHAVGQQGEESVHNLKEPLVSLLTHNTVQRTVSDIPVSSGHRPCWSHRQARQPQEHAERVNGFLSSPPEEPLKRKRRKFKISAAFDRRGAGRCLTST